MLKEAFGLSYSSVAASKLVSQTARANPSVNQLHCSHSNKTGSLFQSGLHYLCLLLAVSVGSASMRLVSLRPAS